MSRVTPSPWPRRRGFLLFVPVHLLERPPIPRWCPVRAWLFFTFLPTYLPERGRPPEKRYGGWCALYCRGAPVGSEAPGGRAWCRRRPAALAAPRRAASGSTSRALQGVFWHVSARQRRQDDCLPCLRPWACGLARRGGRSSERVFELAARDEPAWLVARREPAQYALSIL